MVVIRPKSMATKVSPSACQRSGCWVWRRFGGGWARVIVGVGWCCIEGLEDGWSGVFYGIVEVGKWVESRRYLLIS